MNFKIILVSLLVLLVSCKENKGNKANLEKPETERKEVTSEKPGSYSNPQWGVSFKYPDNYIITESELPGSSPVINIYDNSITRKPPFAIHEESEMSYIAVLPKGYGVDGPSGKSVSISEWSGNLQMQEKIDPESSKVYMLESGEPWAFKLMFSDPPENWNEFGSIFVHFKADSFKAECFSETGEKKSMERCDPMGGDSVSFSGKINRQSRSALTKIIESFTFSENGEAEKVSNLIKIENPLPNIDVKSPIKIAGKARGYWFFEGSAPVKLVDKDNNLLAEGRVEAQGNWMTEDFVAYKGEISFDDAPDDERGYLVFEKANPSGQPENEKTFRLPVLFPPK